MEAGREIEWTQIVSVSQLLGLAALHQRRIVPGDIRDRETNMLALFLSEARRPEPNIAARQATKMGRPNC